MQLPTPRDPYQLTDRQMEMLKDPITVLQLSVRTNNILQGANITTVFELLQCCHKDPEKCFCRRKHLLSLTNFGEKTLSDVFGRLARYGFHRYASKELPDEVDVREEGADADCHVDPDHDHVGSRRSLDEVGAV